EADAESHARPPASLPVDTPADAPTPARIENRPPVDAPPPAPAPRPPPKDERGLTLNVLARAHGVAGRMPDVAPAAALGVEIGPRRRGSAVRPYAGLGLDLAPYASQREGRGRVELGWGAVFGRGCLALDLQYDDGEEDRVRFEPWLCARAEGGTLWAASHGYATNRTQTLGWYAVGLETGLSVWLSRRFSVGAFAHAVVPLVRHDLVLSQALLYRMPWITGEGGLELKMRIW
ncbi:MAG: hypothetical protein K0S65_6685, partial [Labilithrix sp.]|nr:hypothetical protein [Labilithrix sp.]